MIPVPLHTSHLDYDALVNDFMRATQYGNIVTLSPLISSSHPLTTPFSFLPFRPNRSK